MLLINTLESNAQGKEDLTEATITIATILEIWMKVKLSLSSAVCMVEWLKENPMDMEKLCPSTAMILSKNGWKPALAINSSMWLLVYPFLLEMEELGPLASSKESLIHCMEKLCTP